MREKLHIRFLKNAIYLDGTVDCITVSMMQMSTLTFKCEANVPSVSQVTLPNYCCFRHCPINRGIKRPSWVHSLVSHQNKPPKISPAGSSLITEGDKSISPDQNLIWFRFQAVRAADIRLWDESKDRPSRSAGARLNHRQLTSDGDEQLISSGDCFKGFLGDAGWDFTWVTAP